MSELAYSLHLGSDKNRKNISKQNGKNNLSGTTSLPNNAIQNVRQLSKVDKHNYRKYDDNQELIGIVRGTSSPLDDVKELYLSEFEEARLEYNSKQTRPSRMIDNYFDNVSNNEKKDLACEIILELGDKEYWDTKDENFKKKMSEVYKKQVDDLEIILCIAPVPHPNKPMSEEKSVKLRKRSCILAVTLSVVTIALLVFQYQKLSLYVSSGMLLSAIMALLGHFLNRGDNSKR